MSTPPNEFHELAFLTLRIVRLLNSFMVSKQQMVIEAVMDRIEDEAYYQKKFDAALESLENPLNPEEATQADSMIAEGGPL